MVYFRAGWFGSCFTIYFIDESFEIHIEKMNGKIFPVLTLLKKSVVTVIAGPE